MKKILIITVLTVLGSVMLFTGCEKKAPAEKAAPTTGHSAGDGHDHSAHSKDDGHGH